MDMKELMEIANTKNPFSNKMGMKIVELDEKHATAVLTITDDLKNPHGMLHGGAIYTLADTTVGVLSRTAGKKNVTLEGKLNFLKGSFDGTLTSIAHIAHQGKKTGVYTVDIFNEKKELTATGIFTMYFVD